MTSIPKRLTGLALAPRARFIWLALAGFFLGSALCPFNPPSEDGPKQIKQGEIMNNPSESRMNIENMRLNRLASAPSETETATFALG